MVTRILRLLAALLVVNGLLLSSRWFLSGDVEVPWLALEAAFVAGLFLFLPRSRWTIPVAIATSVAVVALSFIALADAGTEIILARPLNLYLDAHLARSVYDLLVGMIGTVPGVLVVTATSLVLLGITVLLTRLLGPGIPSQHDLASVGFTGGGAGTWLARLAGLALMAPLALWIAGLYLPAPPIPALPPRVSAPAVDLILGQTDLIRETLAERDRFAEDLAAARRDYGDVDGLLGRLGGRDVILAFIESYGISVVDDPRYSPVVLPRLEEFSRRMREAGLSIASGTLVAPTQGGQSWYSHGSLLSGLWVDNQLRYDLMLASERETLIDDFRRAGYRTVAIMPAITYLWPEGEQFRYDEIYARADIPYAGPALNWVTMPDQYSWSFLERHIRRPTGAAAGSSARSSVPSAPSDGRSPLFIEIGLISSHAPWTPILPVLEDWDSLDEGEVFSRWANAGERPEELWLDTDRVREHFALSVDYAINAMASYAERYIDDSVILIAMGDHQPAPLITGDGASWEVPVHVIASDLALVEPFLEWGFESGAIPSRKFRNRGMDHFRDWFVRAYSGGGVVANQEASR